MPSFASFSGLKDKHQRHQQSELATNPLLTVFKQTRYPSVLTDQHSLGSPAIDHSACVTAPPLHSLCFFSDQSYNLSPGFDVQ